MDYGKTVGRALRFSVDPKRWVPLFALDSVVLISVLAYLMSNVLALSAVSSASGYAALSPIIGMVAVLFCTYIVWILLRIYIMGALIHQSVKPKDFAKSWAVSRKRYFSLLGVGVIAGLASFFVGIVPYVGWVFSIIVGLVFFFAMPAVVAGKMAFDKALSKSYKIFRKAPVDVFLAWLIISLLSLLIVFIFVLPLLFVFFVSVVPALEGMSSAAGGSEILGVLISNACSLVPALIFMVAGMGIAVAFSVNAQTHFYLQLRKKGR